MSSEKVKVEIEICSNCKSHQWCTRHKEENYSALALDTKRLIETKDPSIDVEIFQVGGTAMGSFEIICKGVVLFSKLGLGYFPHVPSAVTRVIEFVDDFKNGRDLKKYSEARSISPHKTMMSSASNGFKEKSISTSSPKITVKRVKYDPSSQPTKEEDQNQAKEKVEKEETNGGKNPPKTNQQENHKQKIEENSKNKEAESKNSEKEIPAENKEHSKEIKKESNKNILNHSEKELKNEKHINKDSSKDIPENQSNEIKPEQVEVKEQELAEANFILKEEEKQESQSQQPQPLGQSPNSEEAAEVQKNEVNAENPNNEKVIAEKQEEVPESKIFAENEEKKIE